MGLLLFMFVVICIWLISYGLYRICCVIMARKMLIDGEVDKVKEDDVQYDFDLFVIGAGSGGVRASRFSAQYGAKVLNLSCLWFCLFGGSIWDWM